MPSIPVLQAFALLSLVASASATGAPADLSHALERWRDAHGAAWRIERDDDTGFASMIAGARLEADRAPQDDADFEALARAALLATRDLHGVEIETLALERVQFLPLAQIGSVDKTTVRFRQSLIGIDVPEGFVNVLLDIDGRVLSIQTRAVPRLSEIAREPRLGPERAQGLAATAFESEQALVANDVRAPRLSIVRAPRGSDLPGRLAWVVDARSTLPDTMPVGYAYRVDALDGAILGREATVHQFEVRGTVRSFASPGTAPDTSSNPEVSTPMRYTSVTSSLGTVTTDANGNFSFPSASTSLSVTVGYTGPFGNVQNTAGAEYTLTQTLPPNQDNTLTMNPSSSAQITAQANALVHTNVQRDFVRATNPTDSHADIARLANVNLSQTCNAYFDGGSTNYFLAGGGCVNTAYSTVVGHELGHWLNVLYGTGNGMDGMGEGNADVWAMYTYDDPIVGLGFCGTGCNVRTGLNTRAFCGDLFGACYGEVHADGEVWMGAAWKIRARLKTALGNSLGSLTANSLFLGWMNAYNQSQIKSIIETQWILLDDTDGDFNNGSPHYPQIDGGFRDQSFPGVGLNPITFESVTEIGDTQLVIGPYDVSAFIVQHTGGAITSAALFWRANGSAWNQRALVDQGGGRWRSSIPIAAAPGQVDYYVTASDNQAHSLSWPAGAPAAAQAFRIGAIEPFWFENFEGGTAGWTHGTYGDTSNSADDWQFGTPTGQSGTSFQGTTQILWIDPNSAYSGTKCFGTDLGIGANGQYAANSHQWLRSAAIDCSTAIGTTLRFRRWLTVQISSFDQARIRVNGNIAWENPDSAAILENGWSLQEVDISNWADGQSAVVIEFELKTNSSTHLGGWAVDDVQLLRVGAGASGFPAPAAFGPGKKNSTGLAAELNVQGVPSFSTNQFSVYMFQAPAGRLAMLYSSSAPAYAPLFNGTFLLASPFAREIAWQTTTYGDAASDYPIQPWMVGTTRFYQAVFRDPAIADGTGIGLSSAMRIDFWP